MRKPPHGDLFKDYDLHQAFEMLGRRMFPESWNGNNVLQARPTEKSPEAVRQRMQQIEARQAEIRQERSILSGRAARATSDDKKAGYEEDVSELDREAQSLWEELDRLPKPEDVAQKADEYEQRCRVEETLIGALRNRELTWWCAWSHTVDDRVWDRSCPGFHYDIALSSIWWRRDVSAKRRQLVRLHHGIFDDWLERLFPQGDDPARMAETWFIAQMQAPDNPNWSKEDYRENMRSEFGMGPRAFERLWRNHASEPMKKPGRRKSRHSAR